MKETFRSLFKYFIPKFEELELWSMGLSLLLVSAVNYRELLQHYSHAIHEDLFTTLFVSVIAFCGIYFSMVHALISSRKGPVEKFLMLRLAVWFTIFFGSISSALAFKKAEGVWLFFPAWNMLNVFMLLIFEKFKILDEREISDENASGAEIFVSSLIVLLIFGVSNYIWKNDWAITLSMCVAYSCNLSVPIVSVLSFWGVGPEEG